MGERDVWLNGEPSVQELLADPITRLIMDYDRITPEHVRTALDEATRRLRSAPVKTSEAA